MIYDGAEFRKIYDGELQTAIVHSLQSEQTGDGVAIICNKPLTLSSIAYLVACENVVLGDGGFLVLT